MFGQLEEGEEKLSTEDSVPCVCFDHERTTFDRPELWIPVILAMFASILLLFALADLPFGIQLGSLFPYTASVALGTFSAQRGMQPYFFECPIVDRIMPRLLRRHAGFVAAVVLLESIAPYLTRFMPAAWLSANGSGGSLFTKSLCVACVCLVCVQVFTNRSLLERAHAAKQEEL